MERKKFFSHKRLQFFMHVLANGVHDYVEWRPVKNGHQLVHALDSFNRQLNKQEPTTVRELHDLNVRFNELLHQTKEAGLLPVYHKELKRHVDLKRDRKPIRPDLPHPHHSGSRGKIPGPRRH